MKAFSHCIPAFVLGLTIPLTAATTESLRSVIEKSERLEAEGRFADAAALLESHSASADGDLAFRLAQAHLMAAVNGSQVADSAKLDLGRARKWMDRAIELGNPAAYQLLYQVHAVGLGVPVDMEKAVEFLHLGVERGDPGSKTNLAVLAYKGTPPVPKDVHLATRYFMETARGETPDIVAIYYLGVIAFRGEGGLPKDEKGGLRFIEMAAERGISEAERDMGQAFEYGWADRPRDIAVALDWYGKAADHGDPHALWRMGLAWVQGEFGARDPERAVGYFRESADGGERQGMTSLGVMYATGDGVARDLAQAAGWYQKAVDAGDPQAMHNLAIIYANGEGVAADLGKALELAERAEHEGLESADALIRTIEGRMDAKP